MKIFSVNVQVFAEICASRVLCRKSRVLGRTDMYGRSVWLENFCLQSVGLVYCTAERFSS